MQLNSTLIFSLISFLVFLFSSLVNAQVIIKEKVEINPQSVIIPDAPLSNHTIRVDIQWSPASLPGWIMYYDLNCDQNNYSSASSTTGSNTFSLTSPGYENYQIQFRFGSLDPNQPTITGTYQLYYDEQLIRSASFQAQKATYSSYAYFNTHYQSPVLTDYNFSIYASEICPGSYEDIYITTSRNCNATAEINTEQDSITLTIETGREFVSFYKNSQKKDTVTFMFNELGSIYLRQDSTYIGSTPLDINIKSDWTGLIKYQQLVINPLEQFQIRVPDQPRIVYSGGVGALMIEPYSTSICPPYVSENLRYTALIKKGSNRGLLYDYDTGISGDTLTNLTPQEDGEKYLDFITEGEILSQTDTVIVKVFTNDENIDTTEAVIIIYPNEIDVQIIPPVISQGDTASVVLKKRGVNGLEDFAPDKVFNVEIVQGLEFGLILDSLSNDTLTTFSNIPQGFKIIANDSTGIDSTKIRIKVSTEESGFLEERMIRNNTKQNKKEIVDDNENQKNDDEIITPDWIIPGPILLEGFGDVIIKEDECDEEIVVCDSFEPQTINTTNFELLRENVPWQWVDKQGNPQTTNSGSACKLQEWFNCDSTRNGLTYLMRIIGNYSTTPQTIYRILDDTKIKVCLDTRDINKKKWIPHIENIRIPIFSAFCPEQADRCGIYKDFFDATDTTIFANFIKNKNDYDDVMDALDWWWEGPYRNAKNNVYLNNNIRFSEGIITHEYQHFLYYRDSSISYMNGSEGLVSLKTNLEFQRNITQFKCPEDVENDPFYISVIKIKIWQLIDEGVKRGRTIDPITKKDNTEFDCDVAARKTYDDIKKRINVWAKNNGIIQ